MKIMRKVVGVLRLIRPVNCLMMGFAVIVGMIVATRGFSINIETILYGFVTGFAFLAAANTINDYYDRGIDAINEPSRPIPSGVIRPKEALVYVFILSVVGFVTAFLTYVPECLAIATIAWLLSLYYATMGKRTGFLGNCVVSLCVAVPFVYGWFAVGKGLDLLLLLFSVIAFLSNTGREITKGIVDIGGDKPQRVRTLAVLYGLRTAAVTASLFYISSVVFSLFPWILGKVSVWYLPYVVLADAGFVLSSVLLLHDFSCENARRVKNLVLVWMMAALLAFAAGGILT